MEFLIGIALLAAVAMLMLKSKGKAPAEGDTYICHGCGAQDVHVKRTITAWSRGARTFYCRKCHRKWLNEKRKEEQEAARALERAAGNRPEGFGTAPPPSSSGSGARTGKAASTGGCLLAVMGLAAAVMTAALLI